jgi:hypothetical protein
MSLKIMMAQETIENITSKSMANLLTGVASESNARIPPFGFAPAGSTDVVSNMLSILLYLP